MTEINILFDFDHGSEHTAGKRAFTTMYPAKRLLKWLRFSLDKDISILVEAEEHLLPTWYISIH